MRRNEILTGGKMKGRSDGSKKKMFKKMHKRIKTSANAEYGLLFFKGKSKTEAQHHFGAKIPIKPRKKK